MHIVVCVKEIPDPDIASSVFRVDEKNRKVIPVPGLPSVVSPFDEQAVEAALRLRDTTGEVTITLLSLGRESARKIVRKGLSLGADEAYLLVDSAFDDGDSYTCALALSRAVEKLGDCDLVLTGRQAADSDTGVVGLGIAELLGRPAATLAKRIEARDGGIIVERALGEGAEIVELPLPAVVTVSHELGAVRSASLRETMRAARKPITAWSVEDLGLGRDDVGAAGARRVLERLYIPANDVVCQFIEGANPNEQAANLLGQLRDARVLGMDRVRPGGAR